MGRYHRKANAHKQELSSQSLFPGDGNPVTLDPDLRTVVRNPDRTMGRGP
jgi:hypothetical protein